MKNQGGIDIGYFFTSFRNNVFLIATFLALAITVSVLLIRFLPKKYDVIASVKVNDETNSGIVENLFEGVQIIEENKSTANEIVLLKSFELIKGTLNKLHYETAYYEKENFLSNEIFSNRPFTVKIDSLSDQLINVPIHIKFINPDHYVLSVEDDEVEVFNYNSGLIVNTPLSSISILDTLKSGDYFEHSALRFVLNSNQDFLIDKEYYFVFQNIDVLAEQYQDNLKISPLSKDASILELKLVSSVPEKEVHFINTLIALYIQQGLYAKTSFAERIIDFIDNQLTNISDSLQQAEISLQQFRSDNNVADLSYVSKNVYDELKSLEKQKSEELMRFKYYDYLSGYVSKNDNLNEVLAPSVMGIQDPTLNGLIESLAQYTAEKTAINYSAKEKNPKYNILQKNIENTRSAIVSDVNNIKVASQIKLTDIEGRIVKVNKEIGTLPESERMLINAKRKFDFNDNIYNYFLEKRGEAAIIKESNVTSSTVIDKARMSGTDPVSPNKKMILAFSLGLGFILPFSFIFIKDILSAKILSREDLDQSLGKEISIIEEIPKSNKRRKNQSSTNIDPRCFEAFRSLRLKIEKEEKNKIICFTSLIKGDGKSFCTVNTGKAFAHSSKKVLIVDLSFVSSNNYKELSSKTNGAHHSFESSGLEFKVLSTTTTNVFILSLASENVEAFFNRERLKSFLAKLRLDYDLILIDCPDVTNSANFLAINDLTDVNLFVVRKNHTPANVSKFLSVIGSDHSKYHFIYNEA